MYNISKTSKKIFIIYFGIQIIIALILYPLLPILLKYPPDSINNDFQTGLGEMKYSQQYLLLVFIFIFINTFVLYIQLHRINNSLKNLQKKATPELISKVRYLCLYTPFVIYILEIGIPLVLLPTIFVILHALPIAILKISLIYILFFTLCATISFIFSKEEFKKILVFLHAHYPKLANSVEMPKSKFISSSLRVTLLQQLIPSIMVVITLTSLIAYTKSSEKTGNILFNHYKIALTSSFKNDLYSYSTAKAILDTTPLLNSSDSYFILSGSGKYVTSNGKELSDFLIKYVLEQSESHNGRAYDYYCVDAEATCIPINTSSGKYFVGFFYETSNLDLLYFIIYVDLFFFILSVIIIIYVVRSVVQDIIRVSKNLEKIVEDNSYSKHLPLTSNDEIKELVIAFNEIQELTQNNIKQIQDNQSMLMEKERLASLGQMIGGIAHNLKTPIMSISGAAEGLADLTKEYDISIGDPTVTDEDHHAIVKDMNDWIEKIKTHTSYMSDVITAVKGQAVAFSETDTGSFTIAELLTYVDVLMKHELKNALITLNTSLNVPESLSIKGNINSLVQVLNNIISNAIQSYKGEPNKTIDFTIAMKNKNTLTLTVQDYGSGIPKEVQDKLFKEMITTKGKNGTGLGLFMSYSNIRAHFNGSMTFESEEGKGTKFEISIPLK